MTIYKSEAKKFQEDCRKFSDFFADEGHVMFSGKVAHVNDYMMNQAIQFLFTEDPPGTVEEKPDNVPSSTPTAKPVEKPKSKKDEK